MGDVVDDVRVAGYSTTKIYPPPALLIFFLGGETNHQDPLPGSKEKKSTHIPYSLFLPFSACVRKFRLTWSAYSLHLTRPRLFTMQSLRSVTEDTNFHPSYTNIFHDNHAAFCSNLICFCVRMSKWGSAREVFVLLLYRSVVPIGIHMRRRVPRRELGGFLSFSVRRTFSSSHRVHL